MYFTYNDLYLQNLDQKRQARKERIPDPTSTVACPQCGRIYLCVQLWAAFSPTASLTSSSLATDIHDDDDDDVYFTYSYVLYI